MSALIENVPVPSVTSPVVLGINTGKKASSINSNIYKSYSTSATKKWYRMSSVKRNAFDWDINKNELEFE